MKRLLALVCVALLGGCGGGTPPPDWKVDAADLAERYTKHELRGENLLAERYFQQAVQATGGAGRMAETAHLWLLHCAVRRASLADDPCNEYAELAKTATTPADRAYHRYLTLDWSGLETSVLPRHHAAVVNAEPAQRSARVAAIEDPLGRLLAASLVVQRGEADDGLLALAAETASERGWTRPLLVYLRLQLKRAEARGDAAALAELEARINLVESSFSAGR